jgi:hypothetical protein
MGLAIAVELEDGHLVKDLLGDEGKILLRDTPKLPAMAEEQGCRPLDSFWYHGAVDLPPDFDGDPDWLAKLVEEQGLLVLWFDASDGLACVASLRDGLSDSRVELDRALDALGAALQLAEARAST